MYGAAGTLLGLLALHAATGDPQSLSDAISAGEHLVATALAHPEVGGCSWEVAAASPGGPVIRYLGLLHGAAGIGLSLAELGRVTGEGGFIDTATAAAELILARAKPGVDGESSTWERHIGDTGAGLQAHCHGAVGIGQFFLVLDELVPDARYGDAARRAARAAAATRAEDGRSGLCHGLSGTGEYMIDCYQAFGDPEWLALARDCGTHVRRFRVPQQPGVYAMHDVAAVSPDLYLGYAGIGSFLLRLADPVVATDLVLSPLHRSLVKGMPHVGGDTGALLGAREH
jgi:lantibiotic modifying enzyme